MARAATTKAKPGKAKKSLEPEVVASPAPPSEPTYAVGEQVLNAVFGAGRVVSIRGDVLTIAFKTGTKDIRADFIKRGR